MERVVRWFDVDTPSSSAGGRESWGQGAKLRPTGLVVFATLDRPYPEPLRRSPVHRGFDPVPIGAPSSGDGNAAWRQLRHTAGRGVDWLLGR
jgi:hypothetical protein